MNNRKLLKEMDFNNSIKDLIENPYVLKMQDFDQHAHTCCLDHSMFVSYVSFTISRKLGFDAVSAARGGLLHDLFLYDWHDRYSHCRPHLYAHPKEALKNASSITELNEIEKDCILKHMWPLTVNMPKYKESFVVNVSDKLCAMAEVLFVYRIMRIGKKLKAYCY